jgi:short-subunit dehydrogenase
MQLRGRAALVTGASSGIGRATALALARAGVAVKATGRDDAALNVLAAANGGIEVHAADLGSPDGVERITRWAPSVDILVNNAGFGWWGSFVDMDPDLAEQLVRVNVLAPMRLCAGLLPAMIDRGRGHIVNVASIAGHVGVRNEAAYAATKAALIAFSESLRYEVRGSGVLVTVISPGAVRTSFFEREDHPYARRFPRPVSPERVAGAILRAIETERREVFVPRWMGFPAWLRGAAPGLYRRLAARFG